MNTFTKKITENDADKIKEILSGLNAVFDVIQYSKWRAKTSNFQVTYYTSGKLLIQGKEISSLVKKLNLSPLENSNNLRTEFPNSPVSLNQSEISIMSDCDKYIGTDESGKGDFFGPLVIAGVQASPENKQKFINLGIKDSKKLDDKKILQYASIIKANAVHSVVVINPLKYNELYNKFNNLNKLLAWGHARVIENILEKSPCSYALADKFGDESLIQNALMKNGQKIILKQSVRAESDITVAAASVLARAEFVKRIAELENRYELEFSKGASPKVKEQAKIFIEKYSFSRLNEIAKMHFKTVKE